MTLLARLALVLVSLLASFATYGQDSSAAKGAIDEFLASSGVDGDLQQIAAFALGEIESRKDAIPPDEYARLHTYLASRYDANVLRKSAFEALLQGYDRDNFNRWLTTLRSPLMTQMRQLEEESSSEAAFQKLMSYREQLNDKPPSDTRLALVDRVRSSTGASDLTLESHIAVTRSLLLAINPSLEQNQRLDEARISRIIDDLRVEWAASLEEIAAATYLYTYRDVSDDALAQYAALYETATGQWAMAMTRKAVIAALAKASAQ